MECPKIFIRVRNQGINVHNILRWEIKDGMLGVTLKDGQEEVTVMIHGDEARAALELLESYSHKG